MKNKAQLPCSIKMIFVGQFNNQEEKFSVKSNKSKQLLKEVHIDVLEKTLWNTQEQ